jgi:hypothetical protein
LSIHAPSVGPDVTWQIFHAVGVELPEDAAEYAFLKQLGSSLDQNTSIGKPLREAIDKKEFDNLFDRTLFLRYIWRIEFGFP